MKNKIFNITMFIFVAAFFVGPRVLYGSDQDKGISSQEVLDKVHLVRKKIGNQEIDRLIQGFLPVGYAAYCNKEHGKNLESMNAAISYNQRNEKELTNAVNIIEKKGGLNSSEKEALDKFIFAKVKGDINQGYVSCDNVAERIENGEWDF